MKSKRGCGNISESSTYNLILRCNSIPADAIESVLDVGCYYCLALVSTLLLFGHVLCSFDYCPNAEANCLSNSQPSVSVYSVSLLRITFSKSPPRLSRLSRALMVVGESDLN